MKIIQSIFALLLLSAIPISMQASPRDTAKQQLAIRAAARGALDNLAKLSTTNTTDVIMLSAYLQNNMLKNVKSHKTSKHSYKICKESITKKIRKEANVLLEDAAKRARGHSPLPVSKDDISARLGPSWNKQVKETVQIFIKNSFDPIFKEARSSAVMKQRTEIEQSVSCPAFAKLDTKLTAQADKLAAQGVPLNQASFNELLPWIRTIVISQKNTFNENQKTVSQLGQVALADIQEQYNAQINTVRKSITNNTIPPNLILNTAIEKYLAGILDKYMQTLKPVAGTYPIFTTVKKYTAQQADLLQQKRLHNFITKPGTVSIADNLEQVIIKNPAAHRNPDISYKLLLKLYTEQQRKIIATRYAKEIGKDNTPATTMKISALIKDNPAISNIFAQQIETTLKKELPPVRAAIAQQQFKTFFPTLADQTPFSEPMIEFLYDRQKSNIDNIDTLTKTLAISPEHKIVPHKNEDLLQETDKLAINTANSLATPLVLALGAQLHTLNKLEKENLDQLRRDVAANKPFKTIKQAWNTELQKHWKSQSKNYPEQAAKLFSRTRTELEKTIRQLYDTIKAEPTIEQQPEQQKVTKPLTGKKESSYDSEKIELTEEKKVKEEQEKENQDESNSGMDEKIMAHKGSADFVLLLTDTTNNLCRVIFGCPASGSTLETYFAPTDIEAAAETIAIAINNEFVEVLQAIAKSRKSSGILFWRKPKVHIRVLILENSRETRHITSILLQRKIKEQIETWSDNNKLNFKLDWQESPGF